MTSTVSTKKLTANLAHTLYKHDPVDATVATKIAWVDMRDFGTFLASLMVFVGAVVTFKIFASAAADGSNPVEVKAHATPTTADAAGDTLVLECTSEELAALGDDLRYVSAEVDMGTDTNTAAVSYLRGNPRWAHADLTADAIS